CLSGNNMTKFPRRSLETLVPRSLRRYAQSHDPPDGCPTTHSQHAKQEIMMSMELFNQLEQKVTSAVEALELLKMEAEELREENARLKQEREEWERRLTT